MIKSIQQVRDSIARRDYSFAVRDYETNQLYEAHKKQIAKLNISISEYLQLNMLKGANWSITLNQFPYIHHPGLLHLVYWTTGHTIEEAISRIKNFYLIPPEDYVIWENPPNTQSVKNLKHYQIITTTKYKKLYD